MRAFVVALSAALVFATAAAPAVLADAPAPLKIARTDKGEVLTGPNGMTLYIFTKDTEPGKSTCNGPCAQNWPPFRPEAGAPGGPSGDLTVITRDDGSKQYAYKGKPLYYWKNDKQPGDTTGHGVNSVWFVAQP